MGVALGSIATGWTGDSVTAEGAHEANRTMSRLRLRKKRGFTKVLCIFMMFRKFISGNPYGKDHGTSSHKIRAGEPAPTP